MTRRWAPARAQKNRRGDQERERSATEAGKMPYVRHGEAESDAGQGGRTEHSRREAERSLSSAVGQGREISLSAIESGHGVISGGRSPAFTYHHSAYCLPDVGDGVLVTFEQGDVGSLWNSTPSCERRGENAGSGRRLERRLALLPTEGKAARVPWASSYWPAYQDSINFPWAGPTTDSPAAKYGRAFQVLGVEDAVSRFYGIESAANRPTCTTDADCTPGAVCAPREPVVPGTSDQGRCIPAWWGLSRGAAAAALLFPEPRHAVTHNGVTFQNNDL
jgi:hypothetical protein